MTAKRINLEEKKLERAIDRLGKIEDEINSLNLGAKDLREEIKTALEEGLKPSESTTRSGKDFTAQLTVKGLVRKLHKDVKESLFKTYGKKKFLEICSVKIGDLDKYLSEEDRKQFYTQKRIGGRKLIIFRHED